MNYVNNERLLSSLAAEYVLGTLRGPARHRFETLKVKEPKVEAAVHYWETQLNGLAQNMEAVTVPSTLWPAIEVALGFKPLQSEATISDPVPESLRSKTSANQVWKTVSGFALAACLVLAIMFYQAPSDTQSPQFVAVFNNADQQTLWSLDIFEDTILIRSTQNLERRPDGDYELWIVPKSGEAPISLGLLKQEGVFTLAKHEAFRRVEIAALAVSIEPLGGSPTGAPSEVLYATELAQL